MTQGPPVMLDVRPKPSTIVHLLVATTRRRGRFITGMVTRVAPAVVAFLAACMALSPTIDGMFAWTNATLVHVTFAVVALLGIARALAPASGLLANVSMIGIGWAFLGRAWWVWAEADHLEPWSRVVGGTAYAAIVLLMLTVHQVHVALLLAKRAEQQSEGLGGFD